MRLREALRHQSITDVLTGLHNRRYLDETLRRQLLRSGRKSQPVAVIMLDADHFKRFNDTYGHDAGDLVLRALADLMKEHARGSDVLCRYGGEEFVMIMPEMGLATAVERATRLCEAARLLDVHYGGQHVGRITISLASRWLPTTRARLRRCSRRRTPRSMQPSRAGGTGSSPPPVPAKG